MAPKIATSPNIENNRNHLPCTPTAIETEATDKILCLTNPCECYLVGFQNDIIKIHAVYIPAIDDEAWLIMREYLPTVELIRIQNRFTKDILNINDK